MNKTNEQIKILIVDDSPVNIDFLVELLEDYDARTVIDGFTALEATRNELPDLILLDITMPGLNGYETCRRLKAKPETKDIPVIFLSASNDPQSIVKGFEAGGIDYITKPYNTKEVLARIQTHLKLKFALEKLKHLSDYDELTGALKRKKFMENAQSWLVRAQKIDQPLHLFIISIDNIKDINTEYGFSVGDEVIKAVVVVAKKVLTSSYSIARFIGGEFILLFKDISKDESIQQAELLRNAIKRLRFKKLPELSFTISMGMAESNKDDISADNIIKRANANMGI